MKIAIIGIRGIPFVYSGFEAFAEQFSQKFSQKGHKITVYCRSNYFSKKNSTYKNISLVYLPTLKTKMFETIIHSFFATIHACLLSKYDIIYYLGVGNTIYSFIPRLFAVKTVVNIDGLDWKRKKWGRIAKAFLYFSEFLSSFLPSKTITDSAFVQNYFLSKYRKKIDFIPYGFMRSSKDNKQLLKKYHLVKKKYFVWVGRIVPDNHLEEAIIAFNSIKSDFKLVIVGDDLYESRYKKYVHVIARKNPNIIFTGFIVHEDCVFLMKESFAYIETKRSGGTHPSLIDAFASGSLIISNSHPANKLIIGNAGFYYQSQNNSTNLAQVFKKLLSKDKTLISNKAELTKRTALYQYSWDMIINQYEEMFSTL
jgi:glycosyltransferase involved in cell wall biosynthesis